MSESIAATSRGFGAGHASDPRWFESALLIFIGIHSLKAVFQLIVTGPENLTEGADVAINALPLRALWALAYLGIIAASLRHLPEILASARAAWVLIALVAWCLLSAIWSPQPMLALQYGTTLALTALMGFYFGTRYSTEGVLAVTAWTLAIALSLSAVVVFLAPGWGTMQVVHHGAWSGVFIHKNGLGGASVLGVIVFLYMAGRTTGSARRLWLALSLLALVLAVGARSGTALVALAVIAVAAPLLGVVRLRGLDLFLGASVLAMIALVILILLLMAPEAILTMLGKDPTLTGRVELWRFALEAVMARPLGGYGFESYFLDSSQYGGLRLRLIINWAAPHIHNSWLQIALEVGLIGLALFVAFLGSIIARALKLARATRSPAYRAALLILLTILVYSIVETVLLKRHGHQFILMVALFVSLGREWLALRAGLTVKQGNPVSSGQRTTLAGRIRVVE